jgi:hypothetical protein
MGPGKPRERRELDGEDDEMRQIRASLGAGAQNIVTSMVHPGVNPKKYKNLRVSGFFFFFYYPHLKRYGEDTGPYMKDSFSSLGATLERSPKSRLGMGKQVKKTHTRFGSRGARTLHLPNAKRRAKRLATVLGAPFNHSECC